MGYYIEVRNAGTADAGPFIVAVGPKHRPFAVSGIQANYSSTIWVPDSEWQQPILLDTMNVIDESNEDNNTVIEGEVVEATVSPEWLEACLPHG